MDDKFIRALSIDWSRVPEDSYLRGIPAIAHLDALSLRRPVTFLAGENGTGKSTLLEAMAGEKDKADKKAEKAEAKAQKKEAKAEVKAEKKDDGIASFDDFMKIKLIAAKLIACEKVEKSDKLLKETLDIGNGQTKTVCSGIARFYAPEEMVGKTVVLVNNFAPRKMAGQVSEGMLLCAEDPDGRVRLLTVDGDVAAGSEIG